MVAEFHADRRRWLDGEAAYTNFMQGDCQATLDLARIKVADESLEPLEEPLRSVYEGAAAACLAALHGRSDLWRTAQADAGRVDAGQLGCWDRSVFGILDTLVDAYRADPQVRFTRSGEHAPGCPELGRSEPGHGPAAGGYRMRIHGRNLPATLSLRWNDDETITAARIGSDVTELTVPAEVEPDERTVTIRIAGSPRIEPVYAYFEYDPTPA